LSSRGLSKSEHIEAFLADRSSLNPDAAARKIVEIANGVEQDGLIYIERVNAPCLTAFLG
jgi:hypothetical protein